MLLPVFMLAKRATVSGRVTAAAGLTCFPATVPATLKEKERSQVNVHESKNLANKGGVAVSIFSRTTETKQTIQKMLALVVTSVRILPRVHHNPTIFPTSPTCYFLPASPPCSSRQPCEPVLCFSPKGHSSRQATLMRGCWDMKLCPGPPGLPGSYQGLWLMAVHPIVHNIVTYPSILSGGTQAPS